MKIAVYGGSFNPPHVVHAMVASWLLWTDLVDEVWMVPVYRHAFEGIHDKKLASYSDRVQWCEAMETDVDSRIKVSTIESQLPTPSYSIDTLQALAKQFPEHEFRLCVGSDVIPDLPNWKFFRHLSVHQIKIRRAVAQSWPIYSFESLWYWIAVA